MKSILAINSGSSSLKFALFRADSSGLSPIARGAVERIGQPAGFLRIEDADGQSLLRLDSEYPETVTAVRATMEGLGRLELPAPEVVGHRIVHGGPNHLRPERVTPELLEDLRGLTPFAPLHTPSAVAAIEAVRVRYPTAPQIACFDTGFFADMPDVAKRLPLPREFRDTGVRRYGFHGLSYESIVEQLGDEVLPRTIIAHLGNGVSMAALRDGRPVDTTMGFTPNGGCVMGTRTGDIDPGTLLYLMHEKGMNVDDLDRLVNRESGLLGISGISRDMQTLLEKQADHPAAAEAVESFCHSARKNIGALATTLSGLDLLVFTGGIGERSPEIRSRICEGLSFLGIQLDTERNQSDSAVISKDGAGCVVLAMQTDEDLTIARHTSRLSSGLEGDGSD
ncbi:MAG: acetate kinase [Candidatus Binatia bacterium]|jgi:acetate kinase